MSHDRLGLAERGLKAASEKDDGHGEMPDGLCHLEVVESHAESVGSHEHAQDKEQQQGRRTETSSDLGDQYGEEHQDRCQEQEVVRQQVD